MISINDKLFGFVPLCSMSWGFQGFLKLKTLYRQLKMFLKTSLHVTVIFDYFNITTYLYVNNSFKKSPQEDHKKLPRWHPSRRRSPPPPRRRKERSRSRSRSRSKSRSVSPENKTRTKAFDTKRLGKKSPKPKGKGGKTPKGKKNAKG